MEEKLDQVQQQVAETESNAEKKIKIPIPRPPYPPYDEAKLIAALEEVAKQTNLLCQVIQNRNSNGRVVM